MFINYQYIEKWVKPSDTVIEELMTDHILDTDFKHWDGEGD